MFIPLTVVLLLGMIISFLHVTGLVILTRSKDRYIYGTQKYLIIALSIVMLGFVTLSTVRELIFYARKSRADNAGLCISLYILIVFGDMYYFIMFAITIDRFLVIRLNIKYPLYWNKNRTKKTLMLVSVMLNIGCAVLLCIILQYGQSAFVLTMHDKIYKNAYIYVAPVIDIVFVISATFVYSYIFSTFHKIKRKEKSLRKQVTGNETPMHIRHRIKRFRVPFWIILTFIVFLIVPNILQLISYICSVSHIYFQLVYYGLYRIGFIINAVVYIINMDIVRLKLRKLKRFVFNKT